MPTGMKGMALAESDEGKIHPSGKTISQDRFSGIFGTGGVKTAGLRQKRRKQLLVEQNHKERNALKHKIGRYA